MQSEGDVGPGDACVQFEIFTTILPCSRDNCGRFRAIVRSETTPCQRLHNRSRREVAH